MSTRMSEARLAEIERECHFNFMKTAPWDWVRELVAEVRRLRAECDIRREEHLRTCKTCDSLASKLAVAVEALRWCATPETFQDFKGWEIRERVALAISAIAAIERKEGAGE